MSQHPIGSGRRAIGLGLLAAPAILALGRTAAARELRPALEIITQARVATIFASVIKTHGLESEFTQPGHWGFFVPLDSAVERLPALHIERYRRDRELARQTILNHISDFHEPVTGLFSSIEGTWETRRIKTKAGHTVTLVTGGGPARIGGHAIHYMNIPASNGLCHGIDGVLQV